MDITKHRIVSNKLDYAKGKRPAVDCILCAVAANDPQVDNLVVYRRGSNFITLNLYPYNPGHLMIVPERHCLDVRELTGEEVLAITDLQNLALDVLERVYSPGGFNLGYNLGRTSGASIAHIHLQIVPRFRTEIGFFDILSDSRVIVEDPRETRRKLEAAFAEAAPAYFAGR